MNAWKIFESDLIIQMPLILAGLVDTLKLAGFITWVSFEIFNEGN